MRPAEINRYIALITNEDLNEEITKAWFSCVRSRAPFGVIATVAITSEDGTKAAAMVKRRQNDTVSYVIPLSRDLVEEEANKIIAAFTTEQPDLDFDIEATVVRTGEHGAKAPSISVQQERYLEICHSLAKKQHEDWVSKRSADGWRYGPEMSISERTHPLLRTWDQLPDRYQTVDYDQPQRLLDLLDQHGYSVVARDDLDALFRAIRVK